jgi:hypothetical protein
MVILRFGWVFIVLGLSWGCVGLPSPELDEEGGILIRMPYGQAFERIVNLLESREYTIAMADKRTGIIETHPKAVQDEEGPIHHKSLVSILVHGDRVQSIAYLRLIVVSDYDEERERLFESLKRLAQ